MFRKRSETPPEEKVAAPSPAERITSVLSRGITWNGQIGGTGGVRIEGAFEGEIALRGLLVVGENGRVTCKHLRANTVIVAGAVKGNITAEKLEIRKTGRVWGDVITAAFSTEEGAFLRGKITMEERVDIGVELEAEAKAETQADQKPEDAQGSEPADLIQPSDQQSDDPPKNKDAASPG